MKISRIFLDTSFLIRLYTATDPDHQNAKAYLKAFVERSDIIFLSTVVAAEFGIGEDITRLPLDTPKIRVIPFNLNHARKAAEFARATYAERRKGALAVGSRVVIPNDTKILAQAAVEQTDWFIARDGNCQAVHQFLKERQLLTFGFVDLRTPAAEFFGELF